MAETTGIAWTDATQNFWEGCTKVGPGFDHCYAEARDHRYHHGEHWGTGAPRRRMVAATFNRPVTWSQKRQAYEAALAAGREWPSNKPVPPLWVFSMSLGDLFDNEVDPAWRADAWHIIRNSPGLRWQLVTKRVTNVAKMLPADWGDGSAYRHVGIISTIVTQEEANRDVPRLCALKDKGVRWVGLSMEPLLERVRLAGAWDPRDLDWVIVGGESQQGSALARPFYLDWARDLIGECHHFRVPVFVKQLGDAPVMGSFTTAPFPDRHYFHEVRMCTVRGIRYGLTNSPANGDMALWPEDLRVRQMPRVYG